MGCSIFISNSMPAFRNYLPNVFSVRVIVASSCLPNMLLSKVTADVGTGVSTGCENTNYGKWGTIRIKGFMLGN